MTEIDALERTMVAAMQDYFAACAAAGMSGPEIIGRATGAMQKAF